MLAKAAIAVALGVTLVASGAAAAQASDGVTLEVKFDEALEVRSEAVRDVLDRHRAREPDRLVDGAAAVTARAQARSGRPAPDLASWYHVTLPAGADEDAALAELRALPEVAYAYPAPEPAPPPATPDFTSLQGYFQPAPQGIDAVFSRRDRRTLGAGIRIVDLEQDWYPFHEDLGHDWSFVLGEDQFPRSNRFGDDHGTAVVGVLAARDNGFGVTGGVPEADVRGISPFRRTGPTSTSYRAADAMVYASNFMNPGDVMLLEQQTTGPNGRFAPLEWTQSVFEATQLLTQMGIVVVETGSNGNQNLDGPEFLGRFDRNVRDSGAIMVGAGSSTTRARLGFSVYGSRVDLQGWGHNVTTTGYGGLYGGTSEENKSFAYTATFSGTSSAGPVVTSAVVAVQSYLRATGQGVWSGGRIARLLERTGTLQGGDTSQHIGPLPDLAAALKEIEVDPPATTAALAPAPVNGWYRSPTVTLRASDDRGSGVVRTEYRLDGGPWRVYDGPFTVTGQGGHLVEYRSIDRNGNVEPVKSLGLKVDAVAPTIALTAPAGGSVHPLDSAVNAAYACDDDRSGVATCTGTVASGTRLDTSRVGFHTFTVNASDEAGNAAAPVTVTYQVVWPFAGFFAPVDDPPAMNVARAGRATPVKFGLGGDRGLDVLASGSRRSSAIDCASGAPMASEPAAGRLRLDDGRYIYSWKTPPRLGGDVPASHARAGRWQHPHGGLQVQVRDSTTVSRRARTFRQLPEDRARRVRKASPKPEGGSMHGIRLALVLTLAAAAAPASALAEPAELDPIDPQRWQDQQDMTWDDYKRIPGTEWAAPWRRGSVRQLRIAVVAVDFPDQPFVISQPRRSDPFGNPQVKPAARGDVARFYANFWGTPNQYNRGHTVHEYWMEQTGGRIGAEMTAFGPYRMPRNLFEYGLNEWGQQPACPSGFTCDGRMEPDADALWRADAGQDIRSKFDLVLRVYAGYDETSVWQEFGEMMFQTKEDIPDAWGPPDPDLPNWAPTRYVEWTSWKAAAQQWGLSSIRQGESSGTITHEIAHTFGIADNNNNPYVTPFRRVGSGPWDIMDRGSFNGPGGPHMRWVVPANMGAAMPAGQTLRSKMKLGHIDEANVLRLSRQELAKSGVVVARVKARSAPAGPNQLSGVRVELDGPDPRDRTPACDPSADPLCAGASVFDFYSLETVQRFGVDSFTPDNGVLLAKNKTRENNTCGYTCFTWVIDANPQDIDMVDFYQPDGTPVKRTPADYRQLNDALFHAGTRSGSKDIFVDEANRLAFYVINPARAANGVLSYDVAVRSLDGAGPHRRGAELDRPWKRGVQPGVAASCSFPLRNTGRAVATDAAHPDDVTRYVRSDVYRLSASSSDNRWEARLPNALAAVKAGQELAVPVHAVRTEPSGTATRITLTAVSESDPTKRATATCDVHVRDTRGA